MGYEYDVMLSFSVRHRDAVEAIATQLLNQVDLRPYFPPWEAIPGELWITALERAIDASRTIALFIGPEGLGAWQDEVGQLALLQSAQNHGKRVIPVLLPGACKADLTGFLQLRTPVRLEDGNALTQLVAGITGQAPWRVPGFQPGLELTRWLDASTAPRTTPRAAYLRRLLDFLDEERPLRSLLAQGGFPVGELRLADIVVLPKLSSAFLNDSQPPFENPTKHHPKPQHHTASNLLDLIRQSTFSKRPAKYGIVGDVGSGKSTLLQAVAKQLTEEALENPHAPLPILLDAQGLMASNVGLGYYQHTRPPEEMLGEPHHRWLWLIDGYDEVDFKDREHCRREIRERSANPTTKGVVVTMRPVRSFPRDADFSWLKLEPWSPSDAVQYLESCERSRPESVAHAREVLKQHPQFGSSPLMLTLALAFTSPTHGILRSRAELFDRMVEWIFEEWSSWRDREPSGPEWRVLRARFCDVALQALRSGHTSITEADLRGLLAQHPDHGVEKMLRLSTEHFGLLVPRGDGTYHFLLRSIAEFLAGEAMLANPDMTPADVATAGWAEEPLRHMVGLAALRGVHRRATTTVHRLLDLSRTCFHAAHRTRCVLVAARATLDLGSCGEPVAKRVAKALHKLVTNESSTWIPLMARDVIREVADAQGPCWRALLPLLEVEIERFSADDADDDAADRHWGLFHRSAHVRVATIRRLAVDVDKPDIQCLLLRMAGEPMLLSFMEDYPAEAAALALRNAPREGFFSSHVMPCLLQRLRVDHPAIAGPAACALRPGEAELDVHANAILRWAVSGIRLPSVISEFRQYPGGSEALAKAKPDSTTTVNGIPQDPLEARPRRRHTPRPTVSAFVQKCILEGLGYHFAELSEEAKALIIERAGDWSQHHYRDYLCHIALQEPQHLASVLRRCTDIAFTPEGQEHLSHALAAHEDLRLALLDWYYRNATERKHAEQLFPFRAVEGLILKGDDLFTRMFCEHFDSAIGVPNPRPLDPRLFAIPGVRRAAEAHARNIVIKVDEGFFDSEGEPTRLYPVTAGSHLGAIRSVWVHRLAGYVARSVKGWLHRNETDFITGAMLALGHHLDEDGQIRIGEIIQAEPADPRDPKVQIAAIEYAVRGGFVARFQDSLLRIAKRVGHPLQPAAVAALTSFMPEVALFDDQELASAAKSIVEAFPEGWYIFYYHDHGWVLPLLVTARWDVWIARLAHQRHASRLELEMLRILTTALPPVGQSWIMRFVVRVLGHAVLPWTQSIEDMRERRCGDSYQELLYQLGVNAKAMAGDDGGGQA